MTQQFLHLFFSSIRFERLELSHALEDGKRYKKRKGSFKFFDYVSPDRFKSYICAGPKKGTFFFHGEGLE